MSYKKLVFEEIEEGIDQATIKLECDWQIQIKRDNKVSLHDCILWNDKNSIVDNEEGIDRDEVIGFIDNANSLLSTYKECLAECYL